MSLQNATAWLQELKSNRRTQTMLLVLLGSMGFMAYTLWPSSKASPKGKIPAGTVKSGSSLDPKQLMALQKLPDLAQLNEQGAVPEGAGVWRDLFLLDKPVPPPPPPPPPPSPPPPTPEEIAAQQLAAAQEQEKSAAPNFSYIGMLSSKSGGMMGAFVKGEEALIFPLGAQLNPRWTLVELNDKQARLKNVKFEDLIHVIPLKEAQGPAGNQTHVVNEF